MKKLLKISLVSMLVAMPMIAGAAPVAGDPGATTTGAPTASSRPKYALKGVGDGDGNTATASYVKGAYNAVIKGINNTQNEINTLNTGITTYRNAIGHLTDGKATQAGTVATIKTARTNESIATSSVNFTGVTTTSISATASGNVNLSVPVMSDWENDAEATNPVQTTTSFTNLAVNNLTMSAPSSNTARLTKTGINGNVDVVKYLASMGFSFTTLINVDGDYYAAKSAIYPDGYSHRDVSGLSNGEWAVTWNKYGTLRGMSQCSSRYASDPWDPVAEKYALQPDTITPTLPDAEGKYCYCKMTGFTDTDGNETPMSSLWGFAAMNSTPAYCAEECANDCGSIVILNSAWRSAMFSNVQTSSSGQTSGSGQTSMGFDFTTLINVEGDDYAAKSANYPDPDGENYNEAGLSNGEWWVKWNNYGTVRGMAQCSSRSASDPWDPVTEEYVLQPDGTTSTLPDAEGANCWCKMTGWTPNGGNETPAASLWVFDHTISSPALCAGLCANVCGDRVLYNSDFRSPMFSNVQQ